MRQINRLAHRARFALRRPPEPRWRRAVRQLALTALLAGAAGTAAGLVWHGGLLDAPLADLRAAALSRAAAAGLVVDNITIEGRGHTSRAEVAAILQPHMNASILTVDLTAIQRRLESLPWVRDASVERRLPDALHARIEEHKPLALWRDGGRVRLVSEQGTVIPVTDVKPFVNLPLLDGADAPKHAQELFRLVATEPALARRVTAASRVGARRWNVYLDGRVEVRLPGERAEQAWHLLARKDRESEILARAVEAIDLRNPDYLVLRLMEEVVTAGGRRA